METKNTLNRNLAYVIIIALVAVIVFLIDRLLQYPFFDNIKDALFTIIFPFLTSFFIVYIFHPVLYWFERRFSIKTWVSTLILLFINLILIITLIEILIPILKNQVINIFTELPRYIDRIEVIIKELQDRYDMINNDKFYEIISTIVNNFTVRLGQMLVNFSISSVLFIVGNLWIIIMIPIMVFIMMKDYSYMYDKFTSIFGKHRKSLGAQLLKNIDYNLGNYLRSQLVIMGYTFVGNLVILSIAGMPNAFLFALILALTNIIPYLGPVIGGIPLWIYAYFQSPYLFIVSLITVLLVHLFDSHIGQVLLFERQLKVHPLIIMMVMLIGSAIAGIVGIIIAVPIFIIIREIYRFFRPYLMKQKPFKQEQVN